MDEHGARLLITADDYGYSPRYDDGILEATARGGLDAVGVMALRCGAADPLVATRVEVGLHLEPPAAAPLGAQLDAFGALFGRAPDFIDGHKHCHAEPAAFALEVVRLAAAKCIRVRSVDADHRRLLRASGVATPDRLVGRLSETQPALPPEIEAWLAGRPPAGLTEWMVHPGRLDPSSGSSYDRGREEDLELLLRLADDPVLRAARRPPF